MAAPTAAEMLNAEEYLALRDAFENHRFVSALEKIFSFEQKFHNESMRNEALGPARTGPIIVAATKAQYASEVFGIIQARIKTLMEKR